MFVKIQASRDFPRYTFYPIAFLALHDSTRWKVQTTGTWFKLSKNLPS